MRKQQLILGTRTYFISDIQNGNFKQSKDVVNPALVFCHRWLVGEEKFTLQTSGTTGTPKKISATRSQLKASARLTSNYLGLKKEDNALVCLDTNYIAGIMMVVRALETGMDLYLVEPSANPYESISSSIKIDFVALVPYQIQAVLKSKFKDRLNEGTFLIGGAPLSKKTINELQSFSGNFYATYGMTETLSHIALQKLNEPHSEDYFQTLPDITIEKDERGCLIIHAPHLNPHPIVTNDLVDLIGKNRFTWLGRIDNVINSGGVKITPEKIERFIESVFEELKIENRFMIAGIPHPELGQAVTLIIEGEKLPTSQEQRIAELIKSSLSKYEIPKSIQYIPSFIQTETGKINKVKTLEAIKR